MLSNFGLPRPSLCEVTEFGGLSSVAAGQWTSYIWPSWARMLNILCIGGAGSGGNGVVGAASTAAGGGGGGSGGQSSVTIPAIFLPQQLFVSVGLGGQPVSGGTASRVAVYPDGTANHAICVANAGGTGGNGSGATAGAAGSAASVASVANMPLAGPGQVLLIAGQAGIIGGTTVAGANQTLATSGLIVTGGCGGGGLPAAATVGTNGGGLVTPASNVFYPPLIGGLGAAAATTPGGDGQMMPDIFNGLRFFYSGTGGGSSHGSATGAGLVGGNGAPGNIGSGGGGGGGALTGSTQGLGARGGNGWVVITAF
jgi:hypothetical protein